MSAEELRDRLKRQPFQPFRLVMTDGKGYDLYHPDLMMVGKRSAEVGLTGRPDDPYFDRVVQVDLHHIIRIELLPLVQSGHNGTPQ
jgi:hypothetical protein